MVVHDSKLIGGNFSEPTTSGLVGTPVPLTRARRVDGGYRITGRKAFASMIDAADYVAVMAYPDEATAPTAAMMLLVPRDAAGRRVEKVWDTLGMRATRSDSMMLDECWVSDDAAHGAGGRHRPVPPRWRQLVLGVVHRGLSRHRRRGVQGHHRDRPADGRRPASPSRWPIIRTCAGTWRR